MFCASQYNVTNLKMSEDIITDECLSDSDSMEEQEEQEEEQEDEILCKCGNQVIDTKTYCLKCIPTLCKMCKLNVADDLCVACNDFLIENSNKCVVCEKLTMELDVDICSKCYGKYENIERCIICINSEYKCALCEYDNLANKICSMCNLYKKHKMDNIICNECEITLCPKCKINKKVETDYHCINCILGEIRVGFSELCCKNKEEKCYVCLRINEFNKFIEDKILNDYKSLYFDIGDNIDFFDRPKYSKITEIQRHVIKSLDTNYLSTIPYTFSEGHIIRFNYKAYTRIADYMYKNISFVEFFRLFKDFFSMKKNNEVLVKYCETMKDYTGKDIPKSGWNDMDILDVYFGSDPFQNTFYPFDKKFDSSRYRYIINLKKLREKNQFKGHYMNFLFNLGADVIINTLTQHTMIFLMIIKRLKMNIPQVISQKILFESTSIIDPKRSGSYLT